MTSKRLTKLLLIAMSTSTMARVPQATYIPNKVLLGFAWADSHFNPNTLHLYNGNKPTACRTPIPVLSWVIKYLVMLDNKIERFSSSIIPFPCLPRLSLMGELLRMKSFWLVSILEYIEHRVPLSIANVIWETFQHCKLNMCSLISVSKQYGGFFKSVK